MMGKLSTVGLNQSALELNSPASGVEVLFTPSAKVRD